MKEISPDKLFHPKVIERFLSKLKLGENGCVEWTDAPNADGYGQLSVGSKENQVKVKAHRFAYQLALGGVILKPEINICHHCDNPACVMPTHLFPGTHQDNMTDMANKGRAGKYEERSSVTPDQIKYIRTSNKTVKELREELNLHDSTVRKIRSGISHKD